MLHTGLHLFIGPDRARKLSRIQEFERSLRVTTLDRHDLDGSAVRSADLVALCRQRPAASPVRLIVVDRAQRLSADCVQALVHHAQAIAQTACVVLLVDEELGGRHPLAPFQRQANAMIAVEQFPARDVPAVKPFALLDALGRCDAADALLAVHDQLVNGKEPLELLGLVAWQLQRWVMVRRLLDAGHAAAHIADVSGIRPWQVQRLQSEVGDRPLSMLQELLQRCWQLDADAKRSAVIPRLAVEQLILEICQSPVRDASIFATLSR
jgi:DNA polymerase III delta subunit